MQPEARCLASVYLHIGHAGRLLFSYTGDPDFNVNVECLKRDKDLLDRARIAYDATQPKGKLHACFYQLSRSARLL